MLTMNHSKAYIEFLNEEAVEFTSHYFEIFLSKIRQKKYKKKLTFCHHLRVDAEWNHLHLKGIVDNNLPLLSKEYNFNIIDWTGLRDNVSLVKILNTLNNDLKFYIKNLYKERLLESIKNEIIEYQFALEDEKYYLNREYLNDNLFDDEVSEEERNEMIEESREKQHNLKKEIDIIQNIIDNL